MSAGTDALKSAFRDYQTSGVPATGANEPDKAEIRAAADQIAIDIAAASVGDLGEAVALLQPMVDDAEAAAAAAAAAADDVEAVAEDVAEITSTISAPNSDAPVVLAVTDDNGLAKFVLRSDGQMQSADELIDGGNEYDVPHLKFARTDVSGLASEAQLADGSFADDDPAPPVGNAGDVHLLLVDGQSPFIASATTAVSTTPVSGLLMFDTGIMPTSGEFADPDLFTSFIPHVESGNETSARGMAEGLAAAANDAGRPILSIGSEIVSVVTAVGGQSVDELIPGGTYWLNKTVAIERWATICAADGQLPGQVFWGIWQGEADTATPTGGASWAAKWESARVALEDHVETVLGYRIPIVQVHMQTSANFYYNRPLPLISEAANVLTDYPHVFGSLATYDFDYGGADGVGSHMSTAADAFHAGWRCGYAIGQCWAGERPARIVPAGCTRIGTRIVKVDYAGGYTAPLALSTAIVTDPGDYGFEIGSYDAAGAFTALALDSVRIAGGEAVVLEASADLPGTPLMVRYGYVGGTLDDGDPDPFGSFSGRLTGARGCLQAATGLSFEFDGNTVAEILRAPIHSLTVE